MTQSDPILVAGAGIAGLATALGLARKGHRVTLLERRTRLSEAGAGVQIGPNGVKALSRLGVREAVEAVAFVPEGLSIRQGSTGGRLTTLPLATQRFGAPYLTLLRADLQAALAAATRAEPTIELLLGYDLAAIETFESSFAVRARDGRIRAGCALIGADGLWSRVRLELDAAEPQATGYVAYRAMIPRAGLSPPFDAPEVGLWLGREAHVVHYPVRGGDLLNLVVVVGGSSHSREWDEPGRLADITPHLARWPAGLRALLERAPEWRHWTLYDLPDATRWTRGRLALIGDAAHPVLPFLAQGAVMALEDAVALAETIGASGPGAIPKGLARYERLRAARTRQLAEASRRNGRTYHAAGVTAAIRDGLLRVTPPAMLLGGYDWLYGFDPASYTVAAAKP